jgi:hypothetical protein
VEFRGGSGSFVLGIPELRRRPECCSVYEVVKDVLSSPMWVTVGLVLCRICWFGVFSWSGGYLVCTQYCSGGGLRCFRGLAVIWCVLSTIPVVVWVFLAVPWRHSHHCVVVLRADVGFSSSFLCAGRC